MTLEFACRLEGTNMTNCHLQKLEYAKSNEGTSVTYCTIETCQDGSVYVSGDDIGELILEFSPHNLQNAITYVEELGYRRKT